MFEDEISFEIRKLHLLLNRSFEKASDAKIKPTKLQLAILMFIYQNSKLNKNTYQKDIEKAFEIRPSTVTTILHKMEKDELIHKESESEDARLKRIILTKKAELIREKLKNCFVDLRKIIVTNLTQEEISQYIKITKKIQQNIMEAYDVNVFD